MIQSPRSLQVWCCIFLFCSFLAERKKNKQTNKKAHDLCNASEDTYDYKMANQPHSHPLDPLLDQSVNLRRQIVEHDLHV